MARMMAFIGSEVEKAPRRVLFRMYGAMWRWLVADWIALAVQALILEVLPGVAG